MKIVKCQHFLKNGYHFGRCEYVHLVPRVGRWSLPYLDVYVFHLHPPDLLDCSTCSSGNCWSTELPQHCQTCEHNYIVNCTCGNSLQLRYKILQIKCRFSWLSWCTCRCGHSIFVKHVNVVIWNLWQVIGPCKQAVSIHTYACVQCSHTSVGLTLACLIYWSILNAADVTLVFRVSKTLQKII